MKQDGSHYRLLKSRWKERHNSALNKLKEKNKKVLDTFFENFPGKEKIASAAASLILLSSNLHPVTSLATAATQTPSQPVEKKDKLETLSILNAIVPKNMRVLTAEEEAIVSANLSEYFKMDIEPDINGLRLNRTYGIIGAEQHLTRYPGDNMVTHFNSDIDRELFYSSGMAKGRGAWGYFASSKENLSQKDIDREKWYIAVQTFAVPDYNQRVNEYREFFKYRKMLVVNLRTGQSVVADIADAGPAIWTGKHLGGSPEVMHYLGLSQGSRKGAVLYFFVNDPDDKIPLGPIL